VREIVNKPDNQGGSSSGNTSRNATTSGTCDNVFDFGMLEIGIAFDLTETQRTP